MPKDARPPIKLTPEQAEYVRLHWRDDLRELICAVFANPNLTLRNRPEVFAVKQCLAELGVNESTPNLGRLGEDDQSAPPRIAELSPEQKQHIENNHEASSPLELTRTVFRDDSLTLTAPEGRAVLSYLKAIAPDQYNRTEEPVDELEYRPPRNLTEVMTRVNRLVPNPNGIQEPIYTKETLNAQHRKNLNALCARLNIPRFIHQASQYLRKVDRELFESSFVRLTHNLADVEEADVDQYITYCASIVSAAQTERTIQRLQAQADTEFETAQKVSMTLVEHLKTLNTNLQAEKIRQKDLYKTLSGERSRRINDLTQASLSMHPLVEKWRTKEGRERLIKAAQGKRDALNKEVQRISEMDMLVAEIWGLSKEEIVK